MWELVAKLEKTHEKTAEIDVQGTGIEVYCFPTITEIGDEDVVTIDVGFWVADVRDITAFTTLVGYKNPFKALNQIFDELTNLIENLEGDFPITYEADPKRASVYRRLLKKRGWSVKELKNSAYVLVKGA